VVAKYEPKEGYQKIGICGDGTGCRRFHCRRFHRRRFHRRRFRRPIVVVVADIVPPCQGNRPCKLI
jgi:hypothetical protein